jgi:hypothetical protein
MEESSLLEAMRSNAKFGDGEWVFRRSVQDSGGQTRLGVRQWPGFEAMKQGRLQGCAACAAAQGAERVGAPIPNHKFENSLALYGC